MYSLDINFLNDRAGARPDAGAVRQQQSAPSGSYAPAIAGLLVGLLLPALAGGAWLYLNSQSTRLTAERDGLKANLGTLTALEAQITKLTTQTEQVKAETGALAGVFNEIKPWSAMLQDIRDRIPSGVQVEDITQTDAPPATAATPKGTKPTAKLEISGIAKSFNDVNDFLLTLQRSRFLIAEQTQLVSAQLRDNPTQITVQTGAPGNAANAVQVKLPQIVAYKIQTNLSDIPASELIRELDRKGAVGLVTRIRTLQSKGVIQ